MGLWSGRELGMSPNSSTDLPATASGKDGTWPPRCPHRPAGGGAGPCRGVQKQWGNLRAPKITGPETQTYRLTRAGVPALPPGFCNLNVAFIKSKLSHLIT